MFICEMWLFDLVLPQFYKSDMSRYTNISKYFRESPGLQDKESRLYVNKFWK